MFNSGGCSGVPSPCCSNKISQNLTLTLRTDCGTFTIPMSLASLTAHTAQWQSPTVTFQCKQAVCTNITGYFALLCTQGSPWEIGFSGSTCSGFSTNVTAVCPPATGGFSATINGLPLSCCLVSVTGTING